MNFKSLNINHRLIENISRIGIKEPTEIQLKAIPLVLEGKNIIAKSQTGSGKTLAFSIPIIQKILEEKTRAMIIAPTRDLANQIFENIKNFTKGTDIKSEIFFGGVGYDRQIKMLGKGVDIIVGTPGRILDLSRNKFMNIEHIDYLVIDEADELLDMGFIENIKKIVKQLKNRKQSLLFSATINDKVKKLINFIMHEYEEINVKSKKDISQSIEQIAYVVSQSNKFDLILELLNKYRGQAIIFTRKKEEAKRLTYNLSKKKIKVEALHSDRKQSARMNALKRFRNYEVDVLVSTNVAARGIDIKELPLVINYNLPDDNDSYIHRIGRTGRAGSNGVAISFISKSDLEKIKTFEKITKSKIKIINDKKYTQKEQSNNDKLVNINLKKIENKNNYRKSKNKNLILKKKKR